MLISNIKSLMLIMVMAFPCSVLAVEASGCVETTGSPIKDKIIARALAKGNLSHELGSSVTASSNLETKTFESDGSIQTVDTLTESVSLKSENYISGVQTLAQGYELVDGVKHYCVHLKQEK